MAGVKATVAVVVHSPENKARVDLNIYCKNPSIEG